ncbi:MAG: substrate-binding domain-containing protein, partial [Streptococcaceae bacterium]|nr:substrate-binding domain-containing protein [Streptococcaceae bacterium]
IYGPIATRHRLDSPRIYSAYFDHYEGYKMTLSYLYNQGYRKIGHILGRKENLNTQARIRAIQDFYAEKGLKEEPWIFHDTYHSNITNEVIEYWEKNKSKLDVLSFYYDNKAADFKSEMENRGYQIPEDVAIIGFDNSHLSQLMHITSVDYSIISQAENSFLYIYNQLNETMLPEKKIQVKLVERMTTPSMNRPLP